MKTILNTNVGGEVISPAPGTDFVPLYPSASDHNTRRLLSVNAGTSNAGSVFAVGLAGINRAFATLLSKAGQDVNRYQSLHQALFDQSGSHLIAEKSDFATGDPVRFMLISKPEPKDQLPGYDGICFIDIFQASLEPNKDSLNLGMVYVVPPDRGNYADDNDFLAAISATNRALCRGLIAYQTNHAATYGTIECLRMCLFSGGIYAGSVDKALVAKANLAGLEEGLGMNSQLTSVQFENSEGAFNAIKGQF